MNQNSYGELQYCSRCKNPLEKARTKNIGRGVCLECQRITNNEHNKKRKLIINKKQHGK